MQKLVKAAIALEKKEKSPIMGASETSRKGAERIYAEDGVPPWIWGVSKDDLQIFLADVRAAHAAGKQDREPASPTRRSRSTTVRAVRRALVRLTLGLK